VFKEFVVQIEESLAADIAQDNSDWEDEEPGEEGEAMEANDEQQETDINSYYAKHLNLSTAAEEAHVEDFQQLELLLSGKISDEDF
jgi:hypothetical protein